MLTGGGRDLWTEVALCWKEGKQRRLTESAGGQSRRGRRSLGMLRRARRRRERASLELHQWRGELEGAGTAGDAAEQGGKTGRHRLRFLEVASSEEMSIGGCGGVGSSGKEENRWKVWLQAFRRARQRAALGDRTKPNTEWDDKEEGKESLQQWEDDWDDDDVNDDFSLQLRRELESYSEKK
ncbi:hypothetical protein KSP39_PZI003349 [Platanthera zijinensis]|uniref:26S proteasome complex subunit SEM1 n=1 Tax=Platanthera zijinensis TaxID=2320716 RepID=A0AAP0BY46_9ASPA